MAFFSKKGTCQNLLGVNTPPYGPTHPVAPALPQNGRRVSSVLEERQGLKYEEEWEYRKQLHYVR